MLIYSIFNQSIFSCFSKRIAQFTKTRLESKARKGFISWLQWKSLSPNKILGPNKFWAQKKFYYWKKFGSKKFWVQKDCGPKRFGAKIFFEEILAQNKIWGQEKILGLKFFWLTKIVGKKCLPQKKILSGKCWVLKDVRKLFQVQKDFRFSKKCGDQNIVALKKVLVWKKLRFGNNLGRKKFVPKILVRQEFK